MALEAQEFRCGGRAHAPLAASHSHAGQSFQAIEFARSSRFDRFACFADGDFLATAKRHIVIDGFEPVIWEGKDILDDQALTVDGLKLCQQLGFAAGFDGVALIAQQCEGGQFAADLGGVRSGNATAVAGDINTLAAGATPIIQLGKPGPIAWLEVERAARKIGKLGFRTLSEAVSERIALHRSAFPANLVAQPLHMAGANVVIGPHAVVDGNAAQHQPQAIRCTKRNDAGR